ncbi:hypothetical protein BASA61_002620 [Batrachochytrium salamandrivorans]|nr:hypothetical protein BASA61_002620 [Batrachochytrium salamandrivorans]
MSYNILYTLSLYEYTLAYPSHPSSSLSTLQIHWRNTRSLNLSSYNYLGFAQSDGPCADAVQVAIKKHGLTACSPRLEAGSSELHNQVEALVAQFLGQEDAIVFSMGFATNSTCLPSLVGKGDLVVSDELNHSSLVFGVRLSGAGVKVFKHNDPKDLESVLRDAISQGQPRTHRPWKKIVVIIEGLYSMEGSICNLPAVIELKHRYKFYLYMDEAHSIGALGPNGRGVCDYYGIDPLESTYAWEHLPNPLEHLAVILPVPRASLTISVSHPTLPFMPSQCLFPFYNKFPLRCVSLWGTPATPIITSRVRFCISAAHSLADLEWTLQQVSEVGDLLGLKLRIGA